MSTAVGVADFRRELGDYLDRARLGETIIINSFNRPIARLGPPDLSGEAALRFAGGLDVSQLSDDATRVVDTTLQETQGDLDEADALLRRRVLALVLAMGEIDRRRRDSEQKGQK